MHFEKTEIAAVQFGKCTRILLYPQKKGVGIEKARGDPQKEESRVIARRHYTIGHSHWNPLLWKERASEREIEKKKGDDDRERASAKFRR